MEWTSRHSRHRPAIVAALLLATLGSVYVVVRTATPSTPAAWWPASGLCVVTLLVARQRWWAWLAPAELAVLVLGNLLGGHDLFVSVAFSLADVAEALAAAWLVRRHVGRSLDTVRQLMQFFAVVLGTTVLTSLVIASVTGTVLGDSWARTWLTVSASHAAAMLLIVPVVLCRGGARQARRSELGVQTLLLVVVLASFATSATSLAAAFAPVPLLVWAAMRFGGRVVVVQQAAFAVAVTVLASSGGAQLTVHPDSYFSAPQFYLLWLALTGLPVTVAMGERESVISRIATSERIFRRNFSEALLPICFVTYDGRVLRMEELNESASALFGRTTTQVAGHDVAELLTGHDLLTEAATAMSRGTSRGWTGDLGQADQPSRVLRGHLALIDEAHPVGDGEPPLTMSLHLLDMTTTLAARAELEREMAHTRAVLDAADSMIVVASHDGTVLAANPATREITGFAEADLVGRKYWDTLSVPELRALVASHFGPDGSMPATGVTEILRSDGTSRTVSFSNAQVMPRSGADPYHVLTAIDVTAEREHASLMEHLLRSASTVAFVGTDLQGTITLVNTGAESMLGVTAEQAQGQPFSTYVAESGTTEDTRAGRTRAFDAMVTRVGAHGAPETRDWQWLRPGGSYRTVSMTTSTVIDSGGRPIGLLFVGRDVSDTRRSQEILVAALRREREAGAKLRALDSAKDEFISTVSHELRTPMTSIIGTAEMLDDGVAGELNGAQHAMVNVIARNGERLLGLANDLLSVARFDSGMTRTTLVLTDLRAVVAESADLSSSLVSQRRLTLHVQEPDDPVWVHGDPMQLERAVTNLVSNAVKFTPDGGSVTIALAVDPTAGETGAVELSVADTGIGISPEELDRVFERFFRTTTVQQQAIQGTGLGLAIVKSIVETHGGSIRVASRPSEGTTFTLTLPLTEAPELPTQDDGAADAPVDARALTRSD